MRARAEFVHAITYADLSAAITRITRQHLLDTIGCCLAATKESTSQLLGTYLLSEGGAEQATAIGFRRRLPAPQAAFINGLLARTHEFDDMAMPDLHPAGVVVPVALAVSEHRRVSGKDLLAGIALGLELCLRIGWAGYDGVARTSRFLQRGQDSSAICGTLAGAAVAAKLMGLDAKGIADAIGIAVSLAGGSLEANRSGGTIKRFQSGWAAKSAVQAATLASCGVDGPAQAFEGRYGFYRCFIDGDFDAAVLTRGLGTEWRMMSLRFKPYPSNYYTHPVTTRIRGSTRRSRHGARECERRIFSPRILLSPRRCCTRLENRWTGSKRHTRLMKRSSAGPMRLPRRCSEEPASDLGSTISLTNWSLIPSGVS